jgi:hypothetical protein
VSPDDGAAPAAPTEERAGELAPDAPAPDAPASPPVGRIGRRPLLFAAAGVALLAAYAGPKVPRDQRLRVLLGPKARGARSVRIAWSSHGDPLREAALTFPEGAPDTVLQEVRLPDGDYDVEVEVDTQEGRSAARKRVTLGGATATLDLRDER